MKPGLSQISQAKPATKVRALRSATEIDEPDHVLDDGEVGGEAREHLAGAHVQEEGLVQAEHVAIEPLAQVGHHPLAQPVDEEEPPGGGERQSRGRSARPAGSSGRPSRSCARRRRGRSSSRSASVSPSVAAVERIRKTPAAAASARWARTSGPRLASGRRSRRLSRPSAAASISAANTCPAPGRPSMPAPSVVILEPLRLPRPQCIGAPPRRGRRGVLRHSGCWKSAGGTREARHPSRLPHDHRGDDGRDDLSDPLHLRQGRRGAAPGRRSEDPPGVDRRRPAR